MRLVLVRLSALGDIVHTWPLAEALKATDPQGHLTWVVEAPFVPLVEGHPAVDRVVAVRTKAWRRRPLARTTRAAVAEARGALSRPQPDLCVDAQGLMKSAAVCRWTRARRRVGLARPWRRELLAGLAYTETLPGSRHGHVVATNLALVAAAGGSPPPEPTPPAGGWLLERAAPRRPQGVWGPAPVVLLPGAGWADKVLAVECLAAVARHVVGAGVEAVVAWGPGEEARARAVVEAAGAGVHLAPPTDLLELAALLGSAALVVGGDTGPVHLAASFGVPTVAVFLASDPGRNRPLGPATAVVAATDASRTGPTGSAAAEPRRPIGAADITAAIERLAPGLGR